eukprot:6775822-Prymnesium_polylepis.1
MRFYAEVRAARASAHAHSRAATRAVEVDEHLTLSVRGAQRCVMNRRLRDGLDTLIGTGMRRAWLRWNGEWRNRSRLKHGVELVFDFVSGKGTRRALNSWSAFMDASYAASDRLASVKLMLQGRVLRSINKWRSYTKKSRRLKR